MRLESFTIQANPVYAPTFVLVGERHLIAQRARNYPCVPALPAKRLEILEAVASVVYRQQREVVLVAVAFGDLHGFHQADLADDEARHSDADATSDVAGTATELPLLEAVHKMPGPGLLHQQGALQRLRIHEARRSEGFKILSF